MSFRSVLTFLLVVCGVAALIVAVTFIRSHLADNGAAAASQPAMHADGSASLPEYPTSAYACTGPQKSAASHASLQDIAERGRMFAQEQHGPEALARFNDLQQLNPGFPGLQLDRATALMASQKYEEALRAVNLQISISQCLGRLTASALDSYCRRELPDRTIVQCEAQLHTVERTSHFQAAIIEMQIGKQTGGGPLQAADIGVATPPMEARPAPAVQTGPVAAKAPRRTVPAAKQQGKIDPLASAAGTDAALGAYSR